MQIKDPNIRFACESDIKTVRHMMDVAVENLPSRDWYIDDDEDHIGHHINSDQGYILIYTVDGNSAGFLLVHHPGTGPDNLGRNLSFPEEDLPYASHIESSCVLPKYQGRHILSLLIKEAMRLDQAEGYRYFMSTVHPDNFYSINSHLRLGFEAAALVEKYGGLKRNIMLKRL